MALHIFRSYASGFFGPLDPAVRERLVADAAAHDPMHARFTAAGTFTYDLRYGSFRFRYEVRVQADTPDEAHELMVATVRAKAVAHLERIGLGHLDPTKLRIGGTDMATMWDPA